MKSHTELFVMMRTRAMLMSNPTAKQRAIAEFPLKVMNLAMGLKTLCDMRDLGGIDIVDGTRDAMNEMESQICKCFRETFGEDLLAICETVADFPHGKYAE